MVRPSRCLLNEVEAVAATRNVHHNILEKLGADDRTKAVTIALRRGIIHLGGTNGTNATSFLSAT